MMMALATVIGGCAERQAEGADTLATIESMYDEYRERFPDVEGLTADSLRALIDTEGVVVVDVRTPEEWGVSMIPGAITREAFESDPDRYAESTVVAYCTIGARSGQFADEIRRQGFDVVNLEGSILAWTHAGGPLVDPAGNATTEVHVYGERWNLAADGYTAIW